ncbi:MAG: hypothetical protein KJ069_16330 [Anaerolineae bacterium]|nr:hypothetical protein [Anaerolineae bacterium]
MSEREGFHYELAVSSAITMHNIMELEYQQGRRDIDASFRRLKDLSAYSLTHAEILYQREGPELLALGMLFGMTDIPTLKANQERIQALSPEAFEYAGRPEIIEREVARRKTPRPSERENKPISPLQQRLL